MGKKMFCDERMEPWNQLDMPGRLFEQAVRGTAGQKGGFQSQVKGFSETVLRRQTSEANIFIL